MPDNPRQTGREPEKIPSSAAPFFQEYDFARLDVREHAALIIERILAYGNRAEVRWLLETYGREPVEDWIQQSGVRRLPWRRYHMWCLVFDLPEQEKPARAWPH
jgi:hypothetical protein